MDNQLSSQLIEQKKDETYDNGNPVPCWGQAHKCGGIKTVNGILTLLS